MRDKIIINERSLKFNQTIAHFLKQKPKDFYIYYSGLPEENNIERNKYLPPYRDMKFFGKLLSPDMRLINIHLIGFPLCIFPKKWLSDFVGFVDSYQGIFTERCNNCKERRNCYGIPKNYLEKFGDSEFKPFTKEDYLLIGSSQNFEYIERELKKHWVIDRDRQKKIWECYFKNIRGKILDAGAGTGSFLSFAPDRIIGVEKDKTKVDNVVGRMKKIDLRYGDILCLDFDDNYFDGVYSRFVFEHLSLKEVKLALREIKRVLKFKGKLFIMVAGKDDKDFWYVSHNLHFTRESLNRLAEEMNFKRYKVFNQLLLRKYKNFNFDSNTQNNYDYLREKAICLIAEK